jgi:hypothetical protein
MAEIRADLVGDSRSLVRSIDKVGDALEEVVDELAEAGKTGDRELDGLADKLGTVAKAAKEADAATERIGSTTKKSTTEAATATSDFKDEAKQNFGEVASSFSGDMASATDLVQGTLGGLAASLGGPLGLALGAASIALGAVIASAQKDAEKAEELRLVVVEAVQAAFEEGVDVTDFSTSIDKVIAKVQELEKSKEGTAARFFWEDDPSRLDRRRRLDREHGTRAAQARGRVQGVEAGDRRSDRRAHAKGQPHEAGLGDAREAVRRDRRLRRSDQECRRPRRHP